MPLGFSGVKIHMIFIPLPCDSGQRGKKLPTFPLVLVELIEKLAIQIRYRGLRMQINRQVQIEPIEISASLRDTKVQPIASAYSRIRVWTVLCSLGVGISYPAIRLAISPISASVKRSSVQPFANLAVSDFGSWSSLRS